MINDYQHIFEQTLWNKRVFVQVIFALRKGKTVSFVS